MARFGLEPAGYGVVTSHRPSNVDDERRFSEIAAMPALWDGRAAERVVDALDRFLEERRAAAE